MTVSLQEENGRTDMGSATILDQLADHARERVRMAKERQPFEEVKERALALPAGDFAFERALKKPGMSFICECKKASPSKGLIAPEFDPVAIAREYEAAGADCISVLTEPKWFLGSGDYLRNVAQNVSIPCLRKDFTVDPYMIYEARLMGASAVLLICSILSDQEMKEYMEICDRLGLSALTEAHDEEEIQRALRAGARVIGVNNRNLKDFSVDTENSRRLRELVPPEVVFVSESGVQCAEDVGKLHEIGADAVLIGETLMRAADKKAKLAELKSRQRKTKIKLCGMMGEQDIAIANILCPDYIGFVFAPWSKRYVTPDVAASMRKQLRPEITAVGVFVDEELSRVAELLEQGVIDMAQLHGREDEDYIRELKARTGKALIKSVCMENEADIWKAEKCPADYVILDSGRGGTGKHFDWKLAAQVKRPYFLAGGLTAGTVREAVEMLRPYAVDVSSGIETAGRKDAEKMRAFVTAARSAKCG